MQFAVTLKDPDGFSESVRIAAEVQIDMIQGLEPDERKALVEIREDKLRDFMSRWMSGGEYITLVFDVGAGTCTAKKA